MSTFCLKVVLPPLLIRYTQRNARMSIYGGVGQPSHLAVYLSVFPDMYKSEQISSVIYKRKKKCG